MKEILRIPSVQEGSVWHYARTGDARVMHRHDELEVNLVVRGTARYLLSNQRYDLHPGMQIWLFPGQAHVLLDESPDYEMWIVVFRPSLLDRVCVTAETHMLHQANPQGQFCRRLPIEQSARLMQLFAGLRNEAEHDALCFNTGLSYALLSAWRAHRASVQVSGSDVHPAVEGAVRLLRHETPDQLLSVAQLAAHTGLSVSRLSYLFRQQIGVSLVDFRNRERCERFLRVHGRGNRLSIAEAAYEAGFGSYAQFHRVFRQHMSFSPQEYRRRLRRDEAV